MAAQSNDNKDHGNPTEQIPAVSTQNTPSSGEDSVTIPSEARELLEMYSGIAPDKVIKHVTDVRDKAFAIFPYGCISQVRFLTPRLSQLPIYPTLLEELRSGATFLDAGCCFGQEIRYLVRAGIPSSQLHAFDLEQRYIDMGYDLFRDKDKLHAKFVSGDMFAEPGTAKSGELDSLRGKMDIVFASSLLHFFDWDDMLLAAARLVSFTKSRTGSRVVGRQVGSLKAGSYLTRGAEGRAYWHNVESMKTFWHEVGVRTKTQWHVEADLYESEEVQAEKDRGCSDPNLSTIWFSATRT